MTGVQTCALPISQFEALSGTGSPEFKARAFFAIGDIYFDKGDYRQALEFYKRVLSMGIASSDTSGGGLSDYPGFFKEAHVKLANVYKELGDFDKAIYSYKSALDSAGADGAGEIQFKIAESFEESGKINEAIEAYLTNTYLHSQDRYWLLKSYLRLARIFENREDWKEAESIYIKISLMDVDEAKFAQERLKAISVMVKY